VTEAAESHYGDFVAGPDAEVTQRRVGGDTRAQQRRSALKRNTLRDTQHVVFVHGDARGVAAIGGRLAVTLIAVVRRVHASLAVLLFAGFAGFTFTARIDETADADGVAGLPFLDLIPQLHYRADDLVAGHHREYRTAPLVAGLMDIRVTYAAVENVDQHIARPGLAALNGKRCQRSFRGGNSISWSLERRFNLLTCITNQF
jgi:hypothetical protein